MSGTQLLANRLKSLTRDWNEHDLVPDIQKAECREIGEALNKLGGMRAMLDGFYAAKERNRCASVIQAYWDGVGEWRW